jgi:hypothetical protein
MYTKSHEEWIGIKKKYHFWCRKMKQQQFIYVDRKRERERVYFCHLRKIVSWLKDVSEFFFGYFGINALSNRDFVFLSDRK